MRAGRLRHRVHIEVSDEQRNEYGEATQAWKHSRTVWAAVEPLKARERIEGNAVAAEVSHRVVMRYDPYLTSKDRLNFNGRILEIDSLINPDERNIQLELLCKEVK